MCPKKKIFRKDWIIFFKSKVVYPRQFKNKLAVIYKSYSKRDTGLSIFAKLFIAVRSVKSLDFYLNLGQKSGLICPMLQVKHSKFKCEINY